jgi:hypothetical protein
MFPTPDTTHVTKITRTGWPPSPPGCTRPDAVGTVKKAVEVLRAEGLVHTVIGRGIFVR